MFSVIFSGIFSIHSKVRRIFAVGALGLVMGFFSAPSMSADTIKIGVLLPTSGGGASYGIPAENGVKLAIKEINESGGVNGKMLEYFIRDTKLKPAVATAAARELITKEGVDVLVGAVSSGVTLAMSEVAKQEKVILFAPISKSIALTEDKFHKYMFQSSANTNIEGRVMAGVLKKVEARKICATGYDYAYSHDFFASLESNLEEGMSIVDTFYVKLGTKDYNALVSQLMGSDCDTVAGLIWGGGFVSMVKQANPFGLFDQKKFVWGAEVGSHEMSSSLKGDYPEGMWANSYDLWYSPLSDAHQAFLDDLAELEGQKETNMYPVTTYNAVKFLAKAIEIAGGTDSDALVTALEGMTMETPLGPMTIDAKTHRTETGEFWGPMKKVEGSDVLRMSPAEYVY